MSELQKTPGWLDNLSIRRKLSLAFLGLMLVWLSAIGITLHAVSEQSKARQSTTHTYQVLDRASQLRRALREQQVGIRSFLIYADENELKLYQAASREFASLLTDLQVLTADNPVQQTRLARLDASHRHYEQDIALPEIDLARQAAGGDAGRYTARLNQAGREYLIRANGSIDEILRVLDELEDTERQMLRERDQYLTATVQRTYLMALGGAVLALTLGGICLHFLSRQITRPLSAITDLMVRLATGEQDIVIAGQSRRDEMGAMTRALEVFKTAIVDSWHSNWIKTHVNEIASRLQMVSDPYGFATALSSSLAPVVDAGVIVLYSLEGEQLHLIGGYGYRPDAAPNGRFRIGEGLVGQCALERRMVVVDAVPEGYLRIQSATGSAPPRTLILLPLLQGDKLVGVIELGSFGRFSEQHQHLIEQLLPIAALSLENIHRAVHTQELLSETQTQSEELKSSQEVLRGQQEELRATNEALQSKTYLLEQQSARLQSSEEELRVQSEELQASNEELRQRGEILTEQKKVLEALQQETQEKADELARASQYKSDFLANMSHELRTPLNSLLILARGLADNEAGNLTADDVESARVIHESGANLLRLINDILDLSKVEAGKMEVMLEDLSLDALSTTLQRNFRHVAREKGLEFEVQIDPDAPASIRTDADKLGQILNNLLSNAFKFTAKGSVRVIMGRPHGASVGAPQLAIRVSDTGIGIPADKRDKIFQAFEQVDASTSRHYGGTGLGLSIARGLAQLLGGDLQVQSELGHGTTFILELSAPVESDAASAPASRRRESPRTRAVEPAVVPPPRRATAAIADDRDSLPDPGAVILIVEDDLAFARILVDMVRRQGYKALAATDGEGGLVLAAQYHPTGILLDVSLPDIDGWTVIQRLKASTATRHIPVHFISAADDLTRGLDLGAVGFLTKPVTREALTGAFARLLHFSAGQTRRVLVVDDDASSRMAIRKLLAGDDIKLREAKSGEQALADGHFDCIVLDLGLPGMDGFAFLDQAAQRGTVPPVVVYSGRELSREENLRLRQHTDSIVIKGARSPERLLDEVSLFLHSMREAPLVAAREADTALAGRHVLVVDDDMRNIFALSKALRAKGLQVLMAQDGQKALRQLDEHREIELVLMDIMMPGMDGYDTIREIRRQPTLTKLPIIALTAKAMHGDREKCLEAGASDYLSKPIDIDRLLSLMRVWLSAG